jgi:hypothetical protein
MKQDLDWADRLRKYNRGLLIALPLLTSCGGGSSAPGVGIQNVSEAAPRLLDRNAAGDYTPYYGTGNLQRPRYYHEVILDQKGRPVVIGGTDERGYSGLDTIEIFDQAGVEKDTVKPASGAGFWLDTNFEGDPITLASGPRMLFTLNLLADGKILIAGGGSDLLRSKLYEQAEVFDAETRTVESLESKMVNARFRHTSIQLGDGGILFIGGQISAQVTIIDDTVPEGQPGRERQETRFLTTPLCEIFSPKDNEFIPLTFPETDNISKLNTPRGRSNHATSRLAGADGFLNTSDDVILVCAGMQSFSGQFAPDAKFPFNVARQRAVGLQSFEFFDPITRVFTQVSTVALDDPKLNDPVLLNLGQFNDLTIDGVRGIGNMAFVTGGNADSACPVTPFNDLLLVATYTGFGPANGIQFFRILEERNFSHLEGNEAVVLNPLRFFFVARCATNAIAMPRALQTVSSAGDLATWFFTTAGVDIFQTPTLCVFDYNSNIMLAGSVWDPYFSFPAIELGQSARDLRSQRSPNNPFGVIGCWLLLDSVLPTTDLSGYATTQPPLWGRRVGATRVWHRMTSTAGEDGITNSPDDRVIIVGGGNEYGDAINVGGEPTSPSAELVILPGAPNKTPSP